MKRGKGRKSVYLALHLFACNIGSLNTLPALPTTARTGNPGLALGMQLGAETQNEASGTPCDDKQKARHTLKVGMKKDYSCAGSHFIFFILHVSSSTFLFFLDSVKQRYKLAGGT